MAKLALREATQRLCLFRELVRLVRTVKRDQRRGSVKTRAIGLKYEPSKRFERLLIPFESVEGHAGIEQEFVEPAVSVAQCFDETVSRLRSHCS
jgi:hypothetical protein